MTEAEAEARRKKVIRRGHRGSATRMMRQIDELLADTTPQEQRLAQLKLSLEEKLQTLKLLDTEMLQLLKEEELDAEIQQADEYKDQIYAALVKLTPSAATAVATPVTTARPPATAESRIKLPKLVIPSFDGDVTKWMSFWDSYESAIHRNTNLTEIDKFNYLRSLLKGTALEAVAGLTLTAVNYEEAVAILKKRYGNKQAIISRHMETLMGLEAVTSDGNTKSLRRFYDTM